MKVFEPLADTIVNRQMEFYYSGNNIGMQDENKHYFTHRY